MQKKATTKAFGFLITAVYKAFLQNRPLAVRCCVIYLSVVSDIPQDQNPGEVKDYCFFFPVHVISHLNLVAIDRNLNL